MTTENQIEEGSATRTRVDLVFKLSGEPVPEDHGHLLFGALGDRLGDIHNATWLTVFPVLGVPRPDHTVGLATNRGSLRLRVDLDQVPRALVLAGSDLRIGAARVMVGTSRIFPILPAPILSSRIVVIKGFVEDLPFLEAVGRKLEQLGVRATATNTKRRIVRIAGRKVVGFGLQLANLSDEDSVRVQVAGIGGRQRFGCGGFLPVSSGRRARFA